MKHYRKTIKSIRNDNGCGLSKYKKITEGGGNVYVENWINNRSIKILDYIPTKEVFALDNVAIAS